MFCGKRAATLAVGIAAGVFAHADDDVATNNIAPPRGDRSFIMLAPLAGWDRNEYSAFNPYTRRTEVHKDTGGEYGLMASYVSPQFTLNNILFYTDPNDSKVWGDIFAATLSGDPKAAVTWAVGGSYTWHEIGMSAISIRIDEPLVRAGPLLRIPAWHVSLNPYAGFAHLSVHTTYGADSWDTGVYGVLGRWDWRMLHLTAQYYLQDNREMRQVYQVTRARLAAFLTPNWGFMVRGEYMRQYTSKDASLLLGPVYVF